MAMRAVAATNHARLFARQAMLVEVKNHPPAICFFRACQELCPRPFLQINHFSNSVSTSNAIMNCCGDSRRSTLGL